MNAREAYEKSMESTGYRQSLRNDLDFIHGRIEEAVSRGEFEAIILETQFHPHLYRFIAENLRGEFFEVVECCNSFLIRWILPEQSPSPEAEEEFTALEARKLLGYDKERRREVALAMVLRQIKYLAEKGDSDMEKLYRYPRTKKLDREDWQGLQKELLRRLFVVSYNVTTQQIEKISW